MAKMTMDDILSDKPEEKEKPEKVEKAEAPAEAAEKPEREEGSGNSRRREHRKRELEAQGRDPETGQFVPKEKAEEKPAEKPAAEVKPEAKAEPKAPEKPAAPAQAEYTERERALLAEAARHKRRVQELEAARQQQTAAPQPGAAEKSKTFWEDPDAALAAEEKKRQVQALQVHIKTSEMLARSRYTDFEEKVGKFDELVRQTPALAQQMLAAGDPAEFAYRTAKNILDIEKAGGVDKLVAEREAKARAEERAKVEAEYKAKAEEAEKQRAALPGSLSDVTGGGRRPGAVTFNGPTPMGDILKH